MKIIEYTTAGPLQSVTLLASEQGGAVKILVCGSLLAVEPAGRDREASGRVVQEVVGRLIALEKLPARWSPQAGNLAAGVVMMTDGYEESAAIVAALGQMP